MTPLISSEIIQRRISSIAEDMQRHYQDNQFHVVSILNGAFLFTSDLVKQLWQCDCLIDFIKVSSYGDGRQSSGELVISPDMPCSFEGERVLLIDDIVDTGLTMSVIQSRILGLGAAEVKTCALLDKKAYRKHTLRLDYFGFQLTNEFVFGYGLDLEGKHRHLPHIYEAI